MKLLRFGMVLHAGLLVLLLCTTGMTKANPVDMRTAREVAVKFLKANTKMPLRGADDLLLVNTFRTESGYAAFYVFNATNGFVIVSADDCATPILAYSDESIFDGNNLPEQMQSYLESFVAQIQYGVDNHIVANEFTARQWKHLRETGCLNEQKSIVSVGPLLASRWNQNYPYNRFCPDAPGGPGNHAYAGCVATAMGQIMHFWSYPEKGQGSYGGVNFGNTSYAWNQMQNAIPNDPDISEIRPIATLLWHCGVAVDMQYSALGSGADVADVPYAMMTYFNYADDMQYEFKECDGDVYYSDSQWINKIKNCLGLGRPILYGAIDDAIGMGHAFVCDGYDSNDLLHFNWGWSGAGNGYYALGAMNVTNATGHQYYFNICNSAIFNIHPMNSTVSPATQATAFTRGWNWWSSYIELSDINGLGQLESCIANPNTVVQSEDKGYVRAVRQNGTMVWQGTLSSINNEEMYKIGTKTACTATIEGQAADPSSHPIIINKGWNWIGFPCSHNVSVSEALSGFTPRNGDVIKGIHSNATFRNGAWQGTLNTLEPGKGYMYGSKSNATKTLIFQTGNRGDATLANITPENNYYQPTDDFADNMTVIAVVELDGEELRSEDFELAAFAGNECRGSVKLMYVEPVNRYVAFLTVFGDEAEDLHFVLTDGAASDLSADHLTYAIDGIEGTLDEPVVLRFGATDINENASVNVSVYPNPSNGVFNVEGNGIRRIEVVNVYGQVILSNEVEDLSTRIDLGNNAAGIYMLRVVTDNGIATRQILKK